MRAGTGWQQATEMSCDEATAIAGFNYRHSGSLHGLRGESDKIRL